MGGAFLSSCGSDDRPPSAPPTPRPTVTTQLPLQRAAKPRPGEALAARVLRPTELRANPGGRILARLSTRTAFGSSRVLAVMSSRGPWLEVLSAQLPNGRSGWISLEDATLLRVTWSIDVDLSQRQMTLRHRGRVYRQMPVAVGAAATTTPTGLFAVTDRLRTRSAASPYGCCVLALSGRQPSVPQDWRGGDRLAIHGTNRPRSIGTAASLGCIRAGAAAMRLLMARVPNGTPVRVRA